MSRELLLGLALFVSVVVAGAVLYVERARREMLEQRQQELAERVSAMEKELANLGRVARNRLYREALEDLGFGAVQAALRLSVALEEIETAQRILAPHLGTVKRGSGERKA